MMSVKRGKLYDSVFLNLNRSYCRPSMYDALHLAEKQVREIKTMKELKSWVSEWFGETE